MSYVGYPYHAPRQPTRVERWVLGFVCARVGWNYFYFWDEAKHRTRLWIGDSSQPGGFIL